MRTIVLRWGHRPLRDARLTTHVALTARALGAGGMILADMQDRKIMETVDKITETWGGPFSFEMGLPWQKCVKKWRRGGGVVVHLTAYGENIETSDVIGRIRATGRNVMILVGSQKVPSEFFSDEVSDFNVSIGNQPHSECASLAVFLDRLFAGQELKRTFSKAKLRIVPQERSKKVLRNVGLSGGSRKEI